MFLDSWQAVTSEIARDEVAQRKNGWFGVGLPPVLTLWLDQGVSGVGQAHSDRHTTMASMVIDTHTLELGGWELGTLS